MLLSFYDSYWSDDFISEEYDKKGELENETGNVISPGIDKEYEWSDYSNYTNYDDFIDDNADKYFHLFLLQLSRSYLGEEDNVNLNSDEDSSNIESDEIDYSIDLYGAENIINDYLALRSSESSAFREISSNITVRVSSYNDIIHKDFDNPDNVIRSEMIEKIKQGIPVIYCGFSSDSGHSMIAYDYDEINDKIYFHTGWSSDTVMTDKDDTSFVYDTNTSILWFEITDESLIHTHSYNYEYIDIVETGTFLCACQLYSVFLDHINNHFYVNSYDSTGHFSGCTCGDKVNVESHDLRYYRYGTSMHGYFCLDCEYAEKESHNYNIFSTISASGHTMKCICGTESSTVKPHYEAYGVYYTKDKHYVYCECGYLIMTDTHSMVPGWKLGTSRCTVCGYIRNNSGVIEVIKGIEDEAETE